MKPLSAAPSHLQRMLLQLQRYTFTLFHKPGKDMVLADTLSWAYIKGKPKSNNLEDDLICAVNLIELRDYWNFRDELSEADGIILNGEKIVIPPNLRKEMLEIVHRSHLGMVKCK